MSRCHIVRPYALWKYLFPTRRTGKDQVEVRVALVICKICEGDDNNTLTFLWWFTVILQHNLIKHNIYVGQSSLFTLNKIWYEAHNNLHESHLRSSSEFKSPNQAFRSPEMKCSLDFQTLNRLRRNKKETNNLGKNTLLDLCHPLPFKLLLHQSGWRLLLWTLNRL